MSGLGLTLDFRFSQFNRLSPVLGFSGHQTPFLPDANSG
ncbi:hypothetical protein PL11201_550005 [Planktothrix sp. PCC 11201]|nr:hypothetical protein PL11201_550005 [Planktothrix sp. PCC 11201]